MNRFASIRFDRALDEDDRSFVTRVLASRDARLTSWARAGDRTYARVANLTTPDAELVRTLDARIDVPALLVLRVRPVVSQRLGALVRALSGPARPQTVIGLYVTADDLIVELEPSGRALYALLAVVDAALVATPGRTITPVLALSDEMLAQYASLRLREPKLDVSRVIEPYVETFTSGVGSPA